MSTPTPSVLSDMPPELWIEVFEVLTAGSLDNRQPLQTCSLVSKEWNTLARPILFKTLVIAIPEWNLEDRWTHRCTNWRAQPELENLNRILSRSNPSVVGLVRHFILRISGDDHSAWQSFIRCVRSIRAFIRRLPNISKVSFAPTKEEEERGWWRPNRYLLKSPSRGARNVTKRAMEEMISFGSLRSLDVRCIDLPASLLYRLVSLASGHVPPSYLRNY